jgi:dTDP-4-dehydrorhamnose 3,5-epimerase
MDVTATELPGVLLVRPRIFHDGRGTFMETWHRDRYALAGIPSPFVQDNAALSRRGVIRGLHYQYPQPQGKLVMVLLGTVLDVVVDIRRGSPSFGKWLGAELSADNGHQLWIPEGFAHGYAVLSDTAIVSYKCTRAHDPAGDAAIRYDDPVLGIDWPVSDPILSEKDRAAPLLSDMPLDRIPRFDDR